ncbi:MAG: hypothetical protein ABJB97_12765 [Acidobacteriota bacterium]
MRTQKGKQNFLLVTMVGLLLALMVPLTAQAGPQDHDKNRKHEQTDRKHDRKCAKFRNCHDARDGRWDYKGPRGDRQSGWEGLKRRTDTRWNRVNHVNRRDRRFTNGETNRLRNIRVRRG